MMTGAKKVRPSNWGEQEPILPVLLDVWPYAPCRTLRLGIRQDLYTIHHNPAKQEISDEGSNTPRKEVLNTDVEALPAGGRR